MHLNLGFELSKGLALSAYAQNALKRYNEEGTGGAMRLGNVQGARREVGGTLAYRF